MPDDAAADEEVTEERWVYLGKYPGKSRAVVHGWRNPAGRVLYYSDSKSTGCALGYYHLVQVVQKQDDNGATFIRGAFRFDRDRAEDYAQIYLDSRSRDTELELERLLRNARRTAGLADALEPVIKIAAGLKSTAAREALIHEITRAIYRA